MLTLSLVIVFIVTFLVLTIALVVSFLVLQKRAAQRADESLDDSPDAPQDPETLERVLKNEELSSISVWQALLARFDFVEILKKQIAQADLNWSVGRVTLGMLLAGAVSLSMLAPLSWLPLWVATGGSWLAAMSPYFF